jgi:endonuclease/exonuclease/phosphatase family metal-dependent hydrolase
MFHGQLDLDTARGLKVLRERIDAAKIPPSKLDETLNIATWNIREFGKKARLVASIHYIAEIISQFDLVAITELRSNLRDLRRVLDILGPYWNVVYSDYTQDWGGNWERFAYVYDKRAAVFTGLAAEADPFRKKKGGEYLPSQTWWRSPYMASFSAGNFDFVLLLAHIRWGDKQSAREGPLRMLAEWVDKRRRHKDAVDKDFIVMGDFNIPKLSGPLYDAVTSKGLRVPKPLLDLPNKTATTNLARSMRYDQILHYPRLTKSFTNNAGVLDYYAGNWTKLYPGNLGGDRNYTYQLSDHLPLWIQIDTWTDDEVLDQMIQQGEARRRSRRSG